MNPIVRNVLAVIAGILIGGFVNGMLVTFGASLYPPPEGVDPNNIESIKANLDKYSTGQLLVPFWAHAIGTLVGAFITALIATVNRKIVLALLIGAFFLLGGITMVAMVGGPTWFIVLDLLIAYLPMAFLGGMAGKAVFKNKQLLNSN